jgi:hypothetical protein
MGYVFIVVSQATWKGNVTNGWLSKDKVVEVETVDGVDVVDDLMVEDQMGDVTQIQPMHTLLKCRLR